MNKLLYNKAITLIEQKQYRKALNLLLKIDAEDRGSVSFEIASLYSEYCRKKSSKCQKKEIFWYKKSLENGNYFAYTNIALCYQEMHKTKKSIKYFKKALNHGDIDAALDLGKIFLSEGKLKQAKKYLSIVVNGEAYENVTESSVKSSMKILENLKRSC